ncbi:mechanosensitive ion channel family protein [Helcobacillus massiliensis]|uniref:Small conductance mechanosensitive channel n=1 Tax=Helcobacillus massiliensis TaxID=521392 RepID=A0A839QR07_9MICO|nr:MULTISPECIES: mechanosensitive ion channel family protein [Helcobacillus]MBB3022744.1 small conductance mechanosensitive channel [Helcobacillus massiliensis]MCG7426323.1 mechanosensitive ion channel family protein [Helcobacillus sp. ACRRO]MCT1558466.1 mechanosensitive ion channel family protein [Helcobacillus massiliensis]MCT2037145.1 mechanosensitive ion channel family protein [Helcobacillus massiliensis]MCT2332081.1 mechanosensitive ion channel family protein [Helcobacillus massiliensis]
MLISAPTSDDALSWLDHAGAWLLDHGVKILLIIILALAARYVAAILIRRVVRTMLDSGTRISAMTNAAIRRTEHAGEQERAQQRRQQRAQTLSQVAGNVAALIIGALASVMVLSELGIDIAPVIAGLGVVGLAAGIGAQTIIKDIVAGVVMLFEDIVAVGDFVDLEYATGTVESINLRATQLRSIDGVLWTVRNGEIIRIGNMSRGFATALVKLDLDLSNDDVHVTEVLQRVTDALWRDTTWEKVLLDKPQISGILSIDGARYQRRVTLKSAPGRQWEVEQELRRRIRRAFQDEKISFALPRFQEAGQ